MCSTDFTQAISTHCQLVLARSRQTEPSQFVPAKAAINEAFSCGSFLERLQRNLDPREIHLSVGQLVMLKGTFASYGQQIAYAQYRERRT